MLHARLHWLLATSIALGAAAPAHTQSTLRYGGDRAFAPFEYLDDKGTPHGFQIDLLAEIARLEGVKVEIRLDDWPRIETDFRAAKLDMVAMTATRSRREWALFARTHATPATAIYHRKDVTSPVAMADLSGRAIAMVEDSEPMRHVRETFLAGDAYRFVLAPTPRAALEAVRDARADYALMSRAYGDAILAAGSVQGVAASEFSLRLQAYGFAVAPDNQALRQRLDRALEHLEREGKLDALRMQWLASDRDANLRAGLEQRLRWEHVYLR